MRGGRARKLRDAEITATRQKVGAVVCVKARGMKEAWQEIKAHPKVTVTIDLFWMGLVYFRKGQAKEDFLIRFK